MEFAIIDIETTGDKPKNFKIIEIAVIIHDGIKTLDSYQTFVDPEQPITPFISRLTGIQDHHVKGAPKFYEIAKKLVELTAGKIFVAHNVSFDYGVMRREFKRLSFDYRLDHLCTVQTSRVLLPGHDSYSLKKLCTSLGIVLDSHHRAISDTQATAEIFELLFDKAKHDLSNFIKREIDTSGLNPNLDISILDEIPNKIGIYKFYNSDKELIYIGKSIHIKKRIEQHFKNTKTTKAIEMREVVADIDHVLTGSELIALLHESEEIKENQPVYNRAQKNVNFSYGLFLHEDQAGYQHLLIKKNTATEKPLVTFTSLQIGKKQLEKWVDEFNLCLRLCHLHKTTGACFNHGIKKCDGACIALEAPLDYNKKVAALHNHLCFNKESFLIVDKGRNTREYSFVHIENGTYQGYGYIYRYLLKKDVLNFKKFLLPQVSNRDFQSIIKLQLEQNLKLEIVPL